MFAYTLAQSMASRAANVCERGGASIPQFTNFEAGEKWVISQLPKAAAEDYKKLAPMVNQGARYEIMKQLSKDFNIPFPFRR